MNTVASGSGDLQRSLDLLWGSRPRPTRGPRPGLRLDQIVTTAIQIADTEGLSALSMRRVAAELQVGTMSLYRHVPGKSELLDLMLEAVSQPSPEIVEATADGWRAVLEVSAWDSWRLYQSHSWLLQVNWSRPVLGPNAMTDFENTMRGLAELPLTDREKVILITAVDGFVTGVARSHHNSLAAAADTGISDEDFWAAQEPMLQRAMATGRYPTVAAMAEDSFSGGWEETFEFGLQRLLDGLEVLVGRRASGDQVTPYDGSDEPASGSGDRA